MSEDPNITWSQDDIRTLRDVCSCMPQLPNHLLVLALDDRVQKSQERVEQLTATVRKYGPLASQFGWESALKSAESNLHIFTDLLDVVKSIPRCDTP